MEKAYQATIGLEIHAELITGSKMFCSCRNNPEETRPNFDVCPICLGHPGTLPTLNAEAVRHVLRVGLAVGGKLADFTEWDRKNYFYPDIPKGYQISQYKYPLVSGGLLCGVEIERIHLEEDTAKSTHDIHDKKSLVDFNRSGRPLMELVTKPVIHDAASASAFARELRLLLRTLKAGRADMEKGQMRIEANVSVAPSGSDKLGVKTEVKNLNSFKSVEKAVAFEIERQTSLLQSGGTVVQETRGWDENRSETYSQRSKESSHDYRYFPEPDLPKLKISEIPFFAEEALRKDFPELPWNKRARYKKDFALTDKEIAVFLESPSAADYFEAVASGLKGDEKRIRLAANYILNNYLGKVRAASSRDSTGEIEMSPVDKISPASFAELVSLVAARKISSTGAGALIEAALKTKGNFSASFEELAGKLNLIQKSGSAEIGPVVDEVIKANASVVAEYRAGKKASLQFLIGQVMKVTKGSANPEAVSRLLTERM